MGGVFCKRKEQLSRPFYDLKSKDGELITNKHRDSFIKSVRSISYGDLPVHITGRYQNANLKTYQTRKAKFRMATRSLSTTRRIGSVIWSSNARLLELCKNCTPK